MGLHVNAADTTVLLGWLLAMVLIALAGVIVRHAPVRDLSRRSREERADLVARDGPQESRR